MCVICVDSWGGCCVCLFLLCVSLFGFWKFILMLFFNFICEKKNVFLGSWGVEEGGKESESWVGGGVGWDGVVGSEK